MSHALGYYDDQATVTVVGWSPDCEVQLPTSKTGPVWFIDPTGTPREDVDEKKVVLMDDNGTVTPTLGIERAGDVVVFDMKDFTFQRVARGAWGCRYELDESVPTYAEVAPIIERNCISCHHGDAQIPLFGSYEEFYGWSAMIRATIRTQRMPPGGHDPYYGPVEGGFTSDEMGELVRFIEAGLPRGEGEDPLPALSEAAFTEREWGPADHVFTMSETHVVPATGPDQYRYAQISEPLEQDLWVSTIRMTLNGDVTHHVNLVAIDKPLEKEVFLQKGTTDMLRLKKSKREGGHGHTKDESDKDFHWIEHMLEERIVMTYGRSKKTLEFDDGRAMKIPKGSILALEIHYGLTGKIEENLVEVHVYETDGEGIEVKRANLYRDEFAIPANAGHHEIKTGLTLDTDVTVLEFVPHMHRRGKSAKYIALYDDGAEEVILSVPFFQYKFQPHWRLADPKFLPAGTRIVTEMVYDNSDRNPINPNPDAVVKNGSKRVEEMHLPRFYYVEGTL